jgi:hypothetical protein
MMACADNGSIDVVGRLLISNPAEREGGEVGYFSSGLFVSLMGCVQTSRTACSHAYSILDNPRSYSHADTM